MCREVDPSGPLATLRKMLLSEESIASFKKWMMDYWYGVLLIVLTVIALLVSKICYLNNQHLTLNVHHKITSLLLMFKTYTP